MQELGGMGEAPRGFHVEAPGREKMPRGGDIVPLPYAIYGGED